MYWLVSVVVLILVVYGLMVVFGNILGGCWVNVWFLIVLFKMFSGLFIILFILSVIGYSYWLGLLIVLLMGIFVFMNVFGF